MSNGIKLPESPADLIRLAVLDLVATGADPNYTIDMRVWHSPIGAGSTCAVCFAGSVMAQSLNVAHRRNLVPQSFGRDTAEKLEALNFFRVGQVAEAYIGLGIERPRCLVDYVEDIPRYEDDPEGFIADMLDLAYAIDLAMAKEALEAEQAATNA